MIRGSLSSTHPSVTYPTGFPSSGDPTNKVILFEPDPDLDSLLEEACRLNTEHYQEINDSMFTEEGTPNFELVDSLSAKWDALKSRAEASFELASDLT